MVDFSAIEYTNIAKVFIAITIVLIATINNSRYFMILSSQVIKSIVFIAIVIVLYFDIHIGLLLLTLFIIILVQSNLAVIEEAHEKIETFRYACVDDSDTTSNNDCSLNKQSNGEKHKELISEDVADYTLDDKVKPYDVFIKMMTNQEHLEMASNGAIVDY
jgi:hypothetical protein